MSWFDKSIPILSSRPSFWRVERSVLKNYFNFFNTDFSTHSFGRASAEALLGYAQAGRNDKKELFLCSGACPERSRGVPFLPYITTL
ncbi:MAG: hypothetical protein WCT18_04890 [Patescibacteria group bacterium]